MAETYTALKFTASDGYAWSYRAYPAAGEARARVVFLHGIQSHAGWYEHSCAQLARAGFEVCFLDRRGSGGNALERGDAPSYGRLVEDVVEFLAAPPERETASRAQTPVYLIGISWGGKVAVALERRHPGLIKGMALLCPGFFPRVGVSFWTKLRIGWNRWFRPRKLFSIPLNDPELFTQTPRWIDFLQGDPLALHRATARFLFESHRLDRYLRRAPRYVHIPVLLMLAGRDRIINNDRTRAFVQSFRSPDKEVVDYPDAHHTLEFEPDPGPFLADLISWLNKHVGTS